MTWYRIDTGLAYRPNFHLNLGKPYLMRMFRNALFASFLILGVYVPEARAETAKPDDAITFNLAAEGWATTTQARVSVTVDAALSGAAASTARSDMQKAVNGIAKAEWRLTHFNRMQDATGLERWNAGFEARVPENELGGLHEVAKKSSKAGMQLTISDIAFDPTLAEIEATKAKLRLELYKQANDQLAALNAAIPGRQYRIGMMSFMDAGSAPTVQRGMMLKAVAMSADASGAPEAASMERAEKIVQQVQVSYAAVPPVASIGAK
jgi:hypothetical protein